MKELPEVRSKADILERDGERVAASGCYRAIPAARKGPQDPQSPKDRAIIVLRDGTEVFLEPMDSPMAKRPADERRLEGLLVRVTGIMHQYMPAQGSSPLAPCISEVSRITADGPADE